MIGPRCTRKQVRTTCWTRANFVKTDKSSKGPMSWFKAGQFMTSRIPTPLVMPRNDWLLSLVWIVLKINTRNFSVIGGKTCLCSGVRSWKDGNTGIGRNECGGNQFVPINGGEKK